mmetsp:Transcript_40686/g.130830  ORF Transcript_40686/g.130830 Transcript_40686/m.130830 type:complete len:264 (+) Transcript_40686:412-1203(+)
MSTSRTSSTLSRSTSFHSGESVRRITLVLLFAFPQVALTYGSLLPVKSAAIRSCARISRTMRMPACTCCGAPPAHRLPGGVDGSSSPSPSAAKARRSYLERTKTCFADTSASELGLHCAAAACASSVALTARLPEERRRWRFSSLHRSILRERGAERWTPRARWPPQHSLQTSTASASPTIAAHVGGSDDPQSAHTSFPGMAYAVVPNCQASVERYVERSQCAAATSSASCCSSSFVIDNVASYAALAAADAAGSSSAANGPW